MFRRAWINWLVMLFSLPLGQAVAGEGGVRAQEGIQRAVGLLERDKPRKAAKKLGAALRSDDAYTRAAGRFYAGHCLAQLENGRKARRMWARIRKPTEDEPGSAHWYYAARAELIDRLREAGRKRQAARLCRSVLDDEPWDALQAKGAVVLGRFAEREERRGPARRLYERGLKLLGKVEPRAGLKKLTAAKERMRSILTGRLDHLDKLARRRQQARRRAKKLQELPRWVRGKVKAMRRAKKLAEHDQPGAAAHRLRRVRPAGRSHPKLAEARYLRGRYLLAAGRDGEAINHWERFVRKDADGPWRGLALRGMADVELFDRLDVEAARRRLDRLATAVSRLAGRTVEPADAKPGEAAIGNDGHRAARAVAAVEMKPLTEGERGRLGPTWKLADRALVHRIAVLDALSGRMKRAADGFERGSSRPGPSGDRFRAVAASPVAKPIAPGGSAQLIDALRGGTFGVRGYELPIDNRRDSRVGVAVLLGELAYGRRDFRRAEPYFRAIAEARRHVRPTPAQRAYALVRLGQCDFYRFEFGAAQRHYRRASEHPQRRSTEWAAAALKRRGIIMFSVRRRPGRAIALMERVYRSYPDSYAAPDAAYFKGVMLQWTGQEKRARRAYAGALRRYPEHEGMQKAVAHRQDQLSKRKPR